MGYPLGLEDSEESGLTRHGLRVALPLQRSAISKTQKYAPDRV